jgi:hypothetical protein
VTGSHATEVAELLRRAHVRRRRRGGGTLTSEPVVVVRGKHRRDFELLDQDGGQLGLAIDVRRRSLLGDRAAYEFRDAQERCIFNLKNTGSSVTGPGIKWRYEVTWPGESRTISIHRTSRRTTETSISEGSRQIGTMRGKGSVVLAIEDHSGLEVASVHIARARRFHELVDLVVELEDGISEELRVTALAASLITDMSLISFGGGG